MPLDPELAGMLELLKQAPPMSSFSPAEAREMFRSFRGDPATLPPIHSVADVAVPGAGGPLPARIYRPSDAADLPTIVMFHGGGFVIGDLETHDIQGRNLANLCDAVVVAVDYRLAPEHPFPAGVEDAVAAARWAGGHLAELGGSDQLAVAGDSAGANLSAVVAQELRDEGRPLAAQLLVYPAADMVTRHPSRERNGSGYFLDSDMMDWFSENYVQGADPAQPRLSPINGRLTGLAPAVVVVAEYDPLHDDGVAYAKALADAGVPAELIDLPGLIHGFFTMGPLSKAAQAGVEEVCARFRAVLHG